MNIAWTHVAKLADYVFFRHDIHIAKSVGCETCHGRIDTMPLTYRAKALTMEFCIDCHRDAAKAITSSVTLPPNLSRSEFALMVGYARLGGGSDGS